MSSISEWNSKKLVSIFQTKYFLLKSTPNLRFIVSEFKKSLLSNNNNVSEYHFPIATPNQ